MMDVKTITTFYFLGIGGIGMSALARYFRGLGRDVAGYDKTPSPLTAALEREGMRIHYDSQPDLLNALPLDGSALVVYTPAVPADFPELLRARELGLPLLKRAQVLGALTQDHFTIAVSGSHGKTTVSSLIAHILHASGRGCTAFLGGIAANFQSNFIGSNPDLIVVEADEFDRSFLQLEPNIAVVTAVDSDHLDIYGDQNAVRQAFAEFVGQIQPGGSLVARWGLEVHEHFPGRSLSYDLNEQSADRWCRQVHTGEGGSRFVLNRSSREFQLRWPGLHNVENALAAITVAELLDIPEDEIAEALATFRGISRRFEYRLQTPEHVLLDDYAHHPEEIRRLLESVRKIHGRRPLTVLFQPHLFTRTRDLAPEFAEALSKADRVLLLPIYPARELPIAGIDSEWLAGLVAARPEQRPVEVLQRSQVLARVAELRPSLLLTVGAGDIDRLVEPLVETLENLAENQPA
jgi:UDP-N-acetylmuramate--alanine ligase